MQTNDLQPKKHRDKVSHSASRKRKAPYGLTHNPDTSANTPLFLKRQHPAESTIVPAIQRQAEEEEEELQTKLKVGAPDDEYEQEADQVADTVMRMPDSDDQQPTDEKETPEEIQAKSNTPVYLQRMCDDCEEESVESEGSVQMNSNTKTASSKASGQVAHVVHSPGPGKSLPGFVQAKLGKALNVGMAHVRVHNDAQTNQAAESINAKAFTHQNHIYLGKGQSENDLRLMAHEATHVVQQGSMQSSLINRATRRRETGPTTITRTDVETEVAKSYWEAKVGVLFTPVYVTPVTSRFSGDKEERDAVLSVLWQEKPAGKFKRTTTRVVTIPKRAAAKGAKDLIYKFTFKPKTKKKKASVEVEFVAEDSAAKVTAASVPKAGFSPSSFALTYMGFPGNDMAAYFAANPDEHKQLFNWLENLAPAKFDQVVTTEVKKTKGRKTTTRNASFKVEGSKSKTTGMSSLVINFLGALLPKAGAPGSGYHDKTSVDLELEQQQSKKKGKLGTITGLGGLPKDEISSVKYTIWQYFEFGKTRKSAVDVIVPIANTQRSVYYTLEFDTKTNDVDVERIGEAGKGKVKPDQLDINRVQGFSDNSKDVATLSAWLKKRYPGMTVTGKTVAELQSNANKILQSDSDKPDWFQKNYDIHVLSAGDGDARMDTVHGWPAGRRVDIKDYSAADLTKLEMSLQTMSLPVLAHLKALRMVRQDAYLQKKGSNFVPISKNFGYTLNKGSDTTVIIFDSFTHADQFLFSGGQEGVRPASIETFAHELGHAVGFTGGIAAKFNAFVKKHGIKAVSWYAATGKGEQFPEAFAFYNADPEWMRVNQPKLFAWFEILKNTGKPPP